MLKDYLAHSPTEQHPEGQTLEEHLQNVSNLAASFCTDENLSRLAALLGQWHDLGKAQTAFEEYLRTNKGHVDHSTAGGTLLTKRLGKQWAPFIAPVILGHHGGIPDGNLTTNGRRATQLRLAEPVLDEVVQAAKELPNPDSKSLRPPLCRSRKTLPMEEYLGIKLLYSSLVDADYLDTEEYFEPDVAKKRIKSTKLNDLVGCYDVYMANMAKDKTNDENREINALREQIRQECLHAANGPVGFYSLTVPTGGGKTLASLGFALHHAQAHPEMQRIIYAIPFCSIIEQNAAVFRNVLGDEAVLEHHSSVKMPENGSPTDLATENWSGYPVIVTTNVMLFESLFSNKPSQCRKLHNLQNSILILDEMQALPDGILKPCLAMLDALVKDANVTVILCTATQPEYGSIWVEQPNIREIMPDTKRLFQSMQRTKGIVLGKIDEAQLIERLRGHEQVLCIVNRRATAQRIAKALGGEEAGAYCLSTLLCPKHRTQKLDEIRNKLKEGIPCRIISTSLIEAGVDIDLPVVYREAAGLDSVTQAAGRCNRNGKNKALAPVYIFELAEQKGLSDVKQQGSITLNEIFCEHQEDILGQEALAQYFEIKFSRAAILDEKDTLGEIYRSSDLWFPFETIASEFALIRSAGEALFIPYNEEAVKLLERLPDEKMIGTLLRQLQPYSITIYENQKQELLQRGFIKQRDKICWLDVSPQQLHTVYSKEFGLDVTAESAFLCC
jgi:CRISPR-associated helicase Cas3/CRISPR-associated endonuclease Cas3-HD